MCYSSAEYLNLNLNLTLNLKFEFKFEEYTSGTLSGIFPATGWGKGCLESGALERVAGVKVATVVAAVITSLVARGSVCRWGRRGMVCKQSHRDNFIYFLTTHGEFLLSHSWCEGYIRQESRLHRLQARICFERRLFWAVPAPLCTVIAVACKQQHVSNLNPSFKQARFKCMDRAFVMNTTI
jgi:hypothetical protein